MWNVKLKSCKISKSNIRENIFDLGFRKNFLDTILTVQFIKEKCWKLNFTEIKKTAFQKLPFRKCKRSYTLGENICNHISDKWLLPQSILKHSKIQ